MNRPTRFRRSTLDCRAVGRRLQAFLDGEVDDRAAIAEHLDACRDCGLEAATYLEVKASLFREREPVGVEALARLRRFSEDLVGR